MANPVALLRSIQDRGEIYKVVVLWCPGCEYISDGCAVGGLHYIPVSGNPKKRPVWGWNKDLLNVTLTPSILTKSRGQDSKFICHSYLTDGMWRFLEDCTHQFKDQRVPMIPLPDWVVR